MVDRGGVALVLLVLGVLRIVEVDAIVEHRPAGFLQGEMDV